MVPNNTPSIDELFRVITIDRQRNMRMEIELCDENGDTIPIKETAEKITEYVNDKLKDQEKNSCSQQIFPLMANAMVVSLCKLLGHPTTALMLTQDHIRYSFIEMMMIGFYLLKFIQQNNIKIHTTEEPISQEDIDMYERINRASSVATMAASVGTDPRDALRELLKAGKIKQEDLVSLGVEDILTDSSQDGNTGSEGVN